MANKGPISTLRSDFEIYKTQVAICAWCGVAVIIAVIGALFYAFYLIRKNRREFKAKLNNIDPLRRVTVIDRPKLYPIPLHDSVVRLQRNMDRTSYSPYDGPQRSRSELGPNSPPVDYNINSPRPVSFANGNAIRNRSPNDESFLNKNRPFYYQRKREGQPTPTPKTPGGASDVFKF